MPRTLVIHQTQYLPYIGLFAKMVTADVFMFLDTVYYSRTAFINRNRVLTHDGVRWITMPVALKNSLHTEIWKLKIAEDSSWKQKHQTMIEYAYRRHPYFSDVFSIYRDALLRNEDFQGICTAIVEGFCVYLGLETLFCRASNYGLRYGAEEHRIDRLIRLTEAADCDVCVGGAGSLSYSSDDDFARFVTAGKKFEIQVYDPQPYSQCGWYGEFASNLSIIDLLMNLPPQDCVAYLKRTNTIIR